MSAQWPVRVGGEYPSAISLFGSRYRVEALTDGVVHYALVWPRDGSVINRGSVSTETFQRLAHPEDASPIPDLVAALKHVRGYLMTALPENQPEWLTGIPELIAEADKAIAKTEGVKL